MILYHCYGQIRLFYLDDKQEVLKWIIFDAQWFWKWNQQSFSGSVCECECQSLLRLLCTESDKWVSSLNKDTVPAMSCVKDFISRLQVRKDCLSLFSCFSCPYTQHNCPTVMLLCVLINTQHVVFLALILMQQYKIYNSFFILTPSQTWWL